MKIPAERVFSLGQAEMPCTRRSVSKQYKVACTLGSQENTHGKSINLAMKAKQIKPSTNLILQQNTRKELSLRDDL